MRWTSPLFALLVFILLLTVFVVPWKGKTPMAADTIHPLFKLMSPAFVDGASIPAQYTCDALPAGRQGAGVLSPALSIEGTPTEAKSLVLIMDDPDIPQQYKRPDMQAFDHWVLFNIPVAIKEIPEGGTVGTPGANGAGKHAYASPCPPPQYEPSEHRYVFTLYALDMELSLAAGATKAQVLAAMQGHIIAQTQLIGRYKRK